MNTKKSTILLVLLAVVIMPLFTGCFGVGEDDPFISLMTRKARMTGEWEVESYYKNIRKIYGTSASEEVIRVVTDVQGDTWLETTTYPGTGDENEVEGTVLQNGMEFDKNGYFNGIYEYEVTLKESDEDTGETTTATTTYKEEVDGTWNFLAGIDDYSNKERLSLVYLHSRNVITAVVEIEGEDEEEEPVTTTTVDASNYTFANGEMSSIWEINMLKNTEIHLYQDINNFTQVTNTDGTSYTEVGYQQKTLKK
jgi:hypothetical protein